MIEAISTNRDQRPDGTRQTRAVGELAPTFSTKSGAQWEWTARRPSTAVMGDERVFRPGHHGHAQPPQHVGAIKITPEEAACLQDFPLGYVFTGTKTNIFTQIGNAVPRTMARVLALGFTFAQEAEGVA